MADTKPAAKVRRGDPAREDTEERLLVEAAQADPAKFGELYEIHFERIYAFVARRVRDRDTAEDLTSDVFHRAFASLQSYESRGAPFAAWLMRIAANAVADQYKRAAREAPVSDDSPEPAAAANPDLEAVENQARLFRLVSQLPNDQRQVIFERFVEQRSIREIAQQIGRSEGAVKQLQFRALQNLRTRMEGANA
jgi:RNA polymerase sigma-70 factor (ECF subfamily)